MDGGAGPPGEAAMRETFDMLGERDPAVHLAVERLRVTRARMLLGLPGSLPAAAWRLARRLWGQSAPWQRSAVGPGRQGPA